MFYSNVVERMGAGGLNLRTGNFAVLLMEAVVAANFAHSTVAQVLAAATEFNDVNYVPGFGGAGRRALAYTTVPGGTQLAGAYTINAAELRGEFRFDDVTWNNLGGAKPVRAALLFEIPAGAASDADLIPLVFFDTADVATNGTPYVLTVGSDGAIWLGGVA
jgi:hypothetical protein